MQTQNNESSVVIRRDSGEVCPELYSFEENIPKFKFINMPKDFNKSHPVRPAIMGILREGIDDDTSIEGKTRRRYALTAREIKHLLKKNSKAKISNLSYTNLYFHLNKLVGIGAVKVVAYVIEKSHRIAYYGRSAHVIFTSDPEAEIQEYQKKFAEFGKLVTALWPDVNIEELKTLPEKYQRYKLKRAEEFALWIAENESIIRREKLSLPLIFDVLNLIDTLNPEYKAVLNSLVKIFPIDVTNVKKHDK